MKSILGIHQQTMEIHSGILFNCNEKQSDELFSKDMDWKRIQQGEKLRKTTQVVCRTGTYPYECM